MCGIVGYIGTSKAIPIVYSGLESLEYRGYDSAGIAYFLNDNIKVVKEKGKLINLKEKLDFAADTNVAIGHTRWATHGKASITNAHPHSVGKFTVVHNGIIENYSTLKEELKMRGYTFKSETDTEVIPALLDYYYKNEQDIIKTINKVSKILKGSFALGIICSDDANAIYALKNSSPLIIAKSKSGSFLASDVPAILKYTNKYML